MAPLFIPLVTKSDLSVVWKTTLSGLLLAGIPELFMVFSVAILGKEGYQYLKGKVMNFLKKHGPPQIVSRSRYKIGLVMFSIPLLLAFLFPYIENHFHQLEAAAKYIHIGGDVLLFLSLFVLGGEFWDKIRALFTYNAVEHKAELNK
ncbi:MAG: hypothetical protein QNK35_06060 [Bacteroides sp.]|nr:hypothetical protein [Bacteroides sp.]